MTSDGRLLQALLRNDFRVFVEKVFMTLTPGQTFIRSWHLEAIAYQLERVRRGEIKRLIINMPPRSLKSIMASVAFPAFILGRDPTRRIICASYSGELAKKHSNDFRAVFDLAWYRSTFPGTRVGPFKNNETEIELTERGFRLATSVGGTLTGRGGDIIIIDDPLKPDDALSETKRSARKSMVYQHVAFAARRQAHGRHRRRHAARPYGRYDRVSDRTVRRMGGPQLCLRSQTTTAKSCVGKACATSARPARFFRRNASRSTCLEA